MKEVVYNNREKEAWSGLAKAIIYQAKRDATINRSDIKPYYKRSAEAFLNSDWYQTLLDLSSICDNSVCDKSFCDKIDSNNALFLNDFI